MQVRSGLTSRCLRHAVAGVGHETDQVDHPLAARRLLGQLGETLVAVAQDDDVGLRHDVFQVAVEQRGNVRNLRLDVVLVGAVYAGVLDVAVVDAQVETLADEHFRQFHLWAFAQVIGTGLEAQAEQGDLARLLAGDDVEGLLHLGSVAAHQRADQRGFHVQAAGAVVQRAYVLGQAGTTEGEAGLHVVLGEVQLVVLADHVHYLAAVDADCLGDVADLVGEGDLGRVPDVAGVLDHLGDLDVLADDRRIQLAVDAFQQIAGGLVQLTDDGHWREVVVLDRGAFTQELGVHRQAEIDAGLLARAIFENRQYHVLRGTRQHGAAHHHGVTLVLVAHGHADFAAHAFDVVQLQIAVLLARRADTDERHIALQNGGGDVSSAAQAALTQALLQQFFQARLDDGRFAVVDQVDLVRGDVHANHVVTACRQTAGTNGTYITQTEDTDSHGIHLVRSMQFQILAFWPKLVRELAFQIRASSFRHE